jgi:hypothetical protein
MAHTEGHITYDEMKLGWRLARQRWISIISGMSLVMRGITLSYTMTWKGPKKVAPVAEPANSVCVCAESAADHRAHRNTDVSRSYTWGWGD